MHTRRHDISMIAATAFLLPLWSALPAAAAGDDIDARYRQERAQCDSRPVAERSACLRDAAAARQAARSGQLNNERAAYEQNAVERCKLLPAGERDSCIRRSRGEGMVSGSVDGGGIVREYRELTLPPAPAAPAVQADVPPLPAAAVTPPVPEQAPHPAPAGVMLPSR